MSTKRIAVSLLGVGLLGTALTASMCTGTGGGDCTSGTDCAAEEMCHPTLKVCVANCVKQTTACDAEPTCSDKDIITPSNGLSFKNICVCTPASEGTDNCTGTEKCNPYDRVCDTPCTSDSDCSSYPSDQGRKCLDSGGVKFCLMAADTCNATNPCPNGSYCDDIRWSDAPTNKCVTNPTDCDNDTCAVTPTFGLCDPVTANETHNLCVAPDDVTNTCSATGEMGDGGPILLLEDPATDIEEVAAADDPNTTAQACTANSSNTLMTVMLRAYGTLNSAVYTNTFYYNGSAWAAPYFARADTVQGLTYLSVWLCFNASTETRAFYHKNATAESNRVCVPF